jgi:hypothetical protein
VFGTLSLVFLYDNYRIADAKLLGEYVKVGVTANKKVHIDVAVSPQEIVDSAKAIIAPKVYLAKKGIELISESCSEENRAAMKEKVKNTLNDLKESVTNRYLRWTSPPIDEE